MSSPSRSGSSARTSSAESPVLNNSTTSITRILIPRIQGLPPHWFGLTVIRSQRSSLSSIVIWRRSSKNAMQFFHRSFQDRIFAGDADADVSIPVVAVGEGTAGRHGGWTGDGRAARWLRVRVHVRDAWTETGSPERRAFDRSPRRHIRIL